MGGYNKPKYPLDKAMIVRAYCKNQEGQSRIIDHSFFVTTGNLVQYKNTETTTSYSNSLAAKFSNLLGFQF